MDEEQPRLRKRSEVGRARREGAVVQQSLPEVAPPKEEPAKEQASDPRFEIAMREGADENISAFVEVLNSVLEEAKIRIRVSLVVAASWGTDRRRELRAWMRAPKFPPPEILLSVGAKDASTKAKEEPLKASPKPQAVFSLPTELKQRLRKEASLDVPLVDVEAWREFFRDVVILWLDQGARGDERPALLDPYVSPSEVDEERREKPVGVAKSSAELKEEIRKVEDPKSGRPETAERPPAQPVSESDDYNRLIESVLREADLAAEYDELESNLEVGAERTQYGVIYEALDKAEGRARRAFSLAANAKIEHERMRLDQKEVDAELHRRAMEKLREEGDKTRIADVEAKIAELFPDEWRGGKMRVKRSEVSVEMCQKLGELWTQKVRSLQVMLAQVRK